MRVFITGATGLIGRRLVIDRLERGDQVTLVSRSAARASELFAADANPNVTVVEGNPAAPGAWQSHIDGADAVVHLAAAGIADQPWTAAYKKILVDSRIDSTYQVVTAIRECSRPPVVFVTASAVGYYGDTGDTVTDETGPPGKGFLAELAVCWEEQALQLDNLQTRVIRLRIGIVLDERGGMLGRLVPMFRLGLGGPWGSGRQYVPWIHWRDVVGLVDLGFSSASLEGVVNGSAPRPVPVREFARTLGRTLHRPAVLRVPSFALRMKFGEFAESLLASSRVVPHRAAEEGYRFLYPGLDDALATLLSPADATAAAEALSGSLGGDDAPPASIGASATPARAPRLEMPTAPIKLLAISVGGGLLRRDGRLPQGVVHACRSAQRAGCVVVPATSRPPRSVHAVAHALDLVGPTINYNGAAIWNPRTDQPQHHEPLAAEVAREIIRDARDAYPDLQIGIEVLDRWYTDRVDRQLESVAGFAMEPDDIGPLDGFLNTPITKLELIGPSAQLTDLLSLIRHRYWRSNRISLFISDPHVVQIMHPLVDKSIALQRIANRMGVTREQVMAIGDRENDLGMIEWAGFGVAMDNAVPAVKQMADQVVADTRGLGVARAIQRYVLS